MTAIILIALLIATVITALVAFGYFRGPQIELRARQVWKRTPPGVRRVAKTLGHVMAFAGWASLQYPILKEHHSARDWQLYYSLTILAAWAYLTINRVARTLTSPDESFGRGSHA